MKNTYKRLSRSIPALALSLLLIIGTTTVALAASTADMTGNNALSQTLFNEINEERVEKKNSELAYDENLEAAALAYAEAMFGGGREYRRTTDYQTLPSGESVFSLLNAAGYEGSTKSFGYSVWQCNYDEGDEALLAHIETVTATNLYQTRPINGDYTSIGIACATSDDAASPFTVVIMIYVK